MDEDKTPARDQNDHPEADENFGPNSGQMKLPGKEIAKTKRPRFGSKNRLPNPKKTIIITLAVSLLGAGGFAAWKYLVNKPDGSVGTLQPDQSQPQPAAANQQTSPLSEQYSSAELRLDFKYPVGWKVEEGAGGIRIESPEFSYVTVGDSETSGNFRLYIRKGSREVDGKYIGRGVAIQASEQISYKDPVPGQRKDTYLSVFGVDSPDNFNFFMIAGNFNLDRGDTLGPDYGQEASAYIIAGGYSAQELSEDMQMNSVPINTYDQTSAYSEAVEIVKSLQLR